MKLGAGILCRRDISYLGFLPDDCAEFNQSANISLV